MILSRFTSLFRVFGLLKEVMLISFVLLLLPGLVLAQEQQLLPSIQETGVGASVRAHLRSANSKSDINELPSYTIYRHIFLRILFDPILAEKLPNSDWEIVQNLPSHRDIIFVSFAIDSISNACNKINFEIENQRSAQAISMHYLKSKEEIDEYFDDHYDVVLASLSNIGIALVMEEVEKLSAGKSIVSSELDLAGLSDIEPDFVIEFLEKSCANIDRLDRDLPKSQRYLRDELVNAYEDGVLRIHR